MGEHHTQINLVLNATWQLIAYYFTSMHQKDTRISHGVSSTANIYTTLKILRFGLQLVLCKETTMAFSSILMLNVRKETKKRNVYYLN